MKGNDGREWEYMSRDKQQNGNRTLGIYIHIPFCVQKCKYCDFLSMTADKICIERYIKALLCELVQRAQMADGYEVDSIFIGGGTPSCIDAQYIGQIMDVIRQYYCVKGDVRGRSAPMGDFCRSGYSEMPEYDTACEVTIECNPGTLDEDKVRFYRNIGINRISLGLQSASDEELRLLGRIHTWEQFEQSAQLVKQYFTNWNVDVMSALPKQTVETYNRTLEQVFDVAPPHISAYSLIIEEGTLFYDKYFEDEQRRRRGEQPLVLPSEETEREMYDMTGRLMEEHGYHRYEISNYAKEGAQCRHNNRYWLRGDYLGIGLGAASLLCNVRWNDTTHMDEYVRQSESGFQREGVQKLTVNEQMEETMFLGLRRMQGVDMDTFTQVFGKSVHEVYGEVLHRLELQGLVRYSGKYIQLTQLGIDVSNSVLSQFLLE